MLSNRLAGVNLILPTLLETLLDHFSNINLVHQIFPSPIIREVVNQLMCGLFDVHGFSLAALLGLHNRLVSVK